MRFLTAAMACLALLSSSAQGGIRFIIWNYEPVFNVTRYGIGEQHLGLGYDQDLNKRMSLGVQFRLNTSRSGGWVANYQSSFHFSDNTSGSFYLGPNIGVRSIPGPDATVLVPVGVRMGVRGGLERFYADLHVGAQYNIGGGQRVLHETIGPVDLLTGTYCFGLDLGWGWDASRRR